MASKGAPVGNKNASKNRPWKEAIDKALKTYESEKLDVERGHALRKLAERMIESGLSGDMTAIREIGDRLEGKPHQSTEITGPDGGALEITANVTLSPDEAYRRMLHGS